MYWSSRVAQLVKNSRAMRETWIQPLGWEDPLEEGMATHFHILAQRLPGTVCPWGPKELDVTERLSRLLSHIVLSMEKNIKWICFRQKSDRYLFNFC